MTAPPPDLQAWVTETIGGEAAWEPHPASGRSRLIWVVRPASSPDRPLLLRAETGLGPFAGTEFTLAREAAVLRALAGTGVPVPAVHGDGDGHVLMDLVAGDVDLDLSTDAGLVTLASYCRVLATLHRLDPPPGPLPHPASAADHALLDLAAHRRSYGLCSPNPIAEEAFAWLNEHAPTSADRTSLLHGDAGPGNFLHSGGAITGLIDWEMAHVGDPMDDLAWLWFRVTVLGAGGGAGMDGLRQAFHAYAEASGDRLDHNRVNFYCLVVLLRCLVATLVRQRNNPGHTTEPVDRMTRLVGLALDSQRRTGRVGGDGPLAPLPG
ncbi:MAG TPA: phosphotransferase family protein [Pseudonocardia sp.]|nr:phosphotransferase family protein [Pseudonocardia sp.]